MSENEQIIIIEQLPIIRQQLHSIKERFALETAKAHALECTEENLKEVRAVRAGLTKAFKALEDRRKDVKKAIFAPYEEFERIYKECVTDIYKPCDEELAAKITEVENSLKSSKRAEAQEYFDEYMKSLNIDFVSLEQVGLNITLNSSKKSIHTQIKGFLDKINDELQLIRTQPYASEILFEYKMSLNVASAIQSVTERHKAIEIEEAKAADAAEVEEARTAVLEAVERAVEEFAPPIAEPAEQLEEPAEPAKPEKIYTAKFMVRGTLKQLKELKEFLNAGGYNYEC